MAFTSLEVVSLRGSTGVELASGDYVWALYEGKLASDGTLFDANYNFTSWAFAVDTATGVQRPYLRFRLGAGSLIKGWEQGLVGANLGEVVELRIPASLGYGANGAPPTIPANADLIFKVLPVARIAAGKALIEENIEQYSYADMGVTLPVITAFSSDSGVAGDGITSDTTPTLQITATPASTVLVWVNGFMMGAATETAAGLYSFTTTQLDQGETSIDVEVSLSNIGLIRPLPDPSSAPLRLTIDSVAPLPGVLAIQERTGLNDNTFLLAVSGQETGSSVAFERSLDGGTSWIPTTALQNALADGVYRFRAQVSDAAGNTATTAELTTSVDTTPPTPVITAIGGADSRVTRAIGDNLIVGTAEAGRTVRILAGSRLLVSISADDTGAFRHALTAAQLQSLGNDDSQKLRVAQTDAAGNEGFSPEFRFKIAVLEDVEISGNRSLLSDPTGLAYIRGTGMPATALRGDDDSPIGLGTPQSTWQVIGAETIRGGNIAAWRHNPSGALTYWTNDSTWKRTGSVAWDLPGSAGYLQAEYDFNQDFSDDSIIGRSLSSVESAGVTSLLRDSSGNAYARSGATTSVIRSEANTFTGLGSAQDTWQVLAAETIRGTNIVTWRHNPTGALTYWTTNGAWKRTGSVAWDLPNSAGYLQAEYDCNQDFNNDSIIGRNLTAVESAGGTSLLRDSFGNAYARSGAATSVIRSEANTFTGLGSAQDTWQVLAAEAIRGTNRVAWRHNPSGAITTWSTNGAWKRTGSEGWYMPNTANYFQAETDFQMDFNRDGRIGVLA